MAFKRREMTASFEKQIEGKTKEEIREIEMIMLKPEIIPDDTMEKPTAKGIADRAVKLYFPDQQSWDLFAKYFRVSKMVEQSCKYIGPLLALLKGLEDGTLVYHAVKGEITALANGGTVNAGTLLIGSGSGHHHLLFKQEDTFGVSPSPGDVIPLRSGIVVDLNLHPIKNEIPVQITHDDGEGNKTIIGCKSLEMVVTTEEGTTTTVLSSEPVVFRRRRKDG